MATYSNEALGSVVCRLREDKNLTQEVLGRMAGYKKGAGVSISRLENGRLRPSPEKLAGIAEALGTTLEELEAMAAEQTSRIGGADGGNAGSSNIPGDASDDGKVPGSKELKERARKLQDEIDRRSGTITRLSESFNQQHDRARDEFFMKLVELAGRVDGGPKPDPALMDEEDDSDSQVDSVAAYRLKSNDAGVKQLLAGAGGAAAGATVGGAAAYGTFIAAATWGTASTGAAISGLSGVAATNATLALLGGGTLAAGGAGVAGGTILLAGIVAAPALILSLGGLLLMRKRNRKQQQELAEHLDKAEAELSATRPGYEALRDILPRATEILDYIATHAGHALTRMNDQIGAETTKWESLDQADQDRYEQFTTIAAAQLTVVTINVQGLLTTRGEEQARLIELADELLTQSQRVVKTYV